jgi:succinate dehydrogenase/fumarate reductase flavoprotein subunit
MAGLAAAARATELGARVLLLEKGDRPGGSMLLSSGVVWRYRDLETFRQECPGGDPALQERVVDRLDADLVWLEALGAPVVSRETGNALTAGVRFEPSGLTAALAARASDLLLEARRELPQGVPAILATGGFQGSRELVRRYVTPEADHLWLRASALSTGDGLRMGMAAGAATSAGLDEFYGRNLPAPPARVSPDGFVQLAQLYARYARVESPSGEARAGAVSWHESEVVQWTARQPGARAWYVLAPAALEEVVRGRRVGEMVAAARSAGGRVEQRPGGVAVLVAPGITTTLGGLAIDAHARVLDARRKPLAGLYAAGADAGGISAGGWSSGLAAALVFGRIAAESALGVG